MHKSFSTDGLPLETLRRRIDRVVGWLPIDPGSPRGRKPCVDDGTVDEHVNWGVLVEACTVSASRCVRTYSGVVGRSFARQLPIEDFRRRENRIPDGAERQRVCQVGVPEFSHRRTGRECRRDRVDTLRTVPADHAPSQQPTGVPVGHQRDRKLPTTWIVVRPRRRRYCDRDGIETGVPCPLLVDDSSSGGTQVERLDGIPAISPTGSGSPTTV